MHIYSNMQTLRNKMLVGKNEMLLWIGNGANVVVVIIRDLDLDLFSDLF
jgi:hypothetical protein